MSDLRAGSNGKPVLLPSMDWGTVFSRGLEHDLWQISRMRMHALIYVFLSHS